MHRKQRLGGLPGRPLLFFFLLPALGISTADAQTGSGPTLVAKGIAQYNNAFFEDAIATLEQAMKLDLGYRDSAQAYFYLSFSHFKLGKQEDADKFLKTIVRRNPDARLPEGTEEFAASLARIKQQVKQEPKVPATAPPSPRVETIPAPKSKPPPEKVRAKQPAYAEPRLRDYLTGASAGAVLGLASYSVSVLFDNLAADRVKAYSMAGDSTRAAELKSEASSYHSLGSVFYYSSYPLIAVGFYAGLKLSEKVFPTRVSFLEDDSPTRIYCSLDKDLNLSLGVRRSIW